MELAASTGWFVCALIAFVVGRTNEEGFKILALASIPLCLFGLYRLIAGVKLLNRKARIVTRNPINMSTLDVIKKQESARNEKIWLGKAFPWTHKEAQLLYDGLQQDASCFEMPKLYAAIRKALRKPMPEDIHEDDRHGNPMIHGVASTEESDFYFPVNWLSYMMYIVATTGAGKTRFLQVLAMQAVARGEPLIIFDPKGDKDLRDLVYSEYVRRGRPEAFHYFSPTKEHLSVAINPCTNYQKLTQIASRITQPMEGAGNAATFKAYAWQSVNIIVHGLHFAGDEISLVNIAKYVSGDFAPLCVKVVEKHLANNPELFPSWQAEVAMLAKNKNDVATRAAALAYYYQNTVTLTAPELVVTNIVGLFSHDASHHKRVIATFLPIMNMLTSGSLSKLLSPEKASPSFPHLSVDFARICRAGECVYINLESLADVVQASAVADVLAADLTSVAFDTYNDDAEAKPVNVIYDEAGESLNPSIVQQLNKGRGAKFRVAICTQVMSDITVRMGSEDSTMQAIGNAQTTVMLRIKDPKTMEWLSEHSGTMRYRSIDIGNTTTGYTPAEGSDFSGNYSVSHSYTELGVITPKALQQLPALEYFAIIPGGKIIKGRLPWLVPEHRLPTDETRFVSMPLTAFDLEDCERDYDLPMDSAA